MDFTIVTPSFRQLDWLELCLASVADQEGVKIEHIVQDGGTEGFSDFARRMQHRWPDREGYALRMFSEPDQGMYDAVNRGLKKGSAPICAYLNCDEQYLTGALVKVAHFFRENPHAEVVFGGVLVVDSKGQLIAARKPVKLCLPHVVTCHLPNFTCAMFFKRSLLSSQNAWFDARWRDCADALWVADRLKRKTAICRIQSFLTAFTDTGANMNLSANAARESRALRGSAPWFWRKTKFIWIMYHWVRKFLEGSYWPMRVAYGLYQHGSTQERVVFSNKRSNPFWVDRWFVRQKITIKARLARWRQLKGGA